MNFRLIANFNLMHSKLTPCNLFPPEPDRFGCRIVVSQASILIGATVEVDGELGLWHVVYYEANGHAPKARWYYLKKANYRPGPWVGIDLDGTLAEYGEWQGPAHVGAPIAAMVELAKRILRNGVQVKLFTARAGDEKNLIHVIKWLDSHGLGDLEITATKDYMCILILDDRAAHVIPNTGVIPFVPAQLSRLL
jgi:hypothetical protein